MSTIAQVKELLQRNLGPRADELARETHFVRRKRNLDGSDFIQGLVFGYLHQADATTEDLAQILGRREVDISASGLCQRFTQAAAALVERVMQELINEGMQAEQPAPAELLGRFDAVIVEDSSTIKLPDKLKDIWKGCGGGQGQSEAGLKLHVRWDLKQGGLQGPLLTDVGRPINAVRCVRKASLLECSTSLMKAIAVWNGSKSRKAFFSPARTRGCVSWIGKVVSR